MSKLRDALLGKKKVETPVQDVVEVESEKKKDKQPVMARTAIDVVLDKTDGFYYEIVLTYDPISMQTLDFKRNRLSKTQTTAIYSVKKTIVDKILKK